MDERIEMGQWRLNVVDLALATITNPKNWPPEPEDLAHVHVMVNEINRELRAAIEESSS